MVKKHRGNIQVSSKPDDIRLQVWLSLAEAVRVIGIVFTPWRGAIRELLWDNPIEQTGSKVESHARSPVSCCPLLLLDSLDLGTRPRASNLTIWAHRLENPGWLLWRTTECGHPDH
jgi:hypothetical protein